MQQPLGSHHGSEGRRTKGEEEGDWEAESVEGYGVDDGAKSLLPHAPDDTWGIEWGSGWSTGNRE